MAFGRIRCIRTREFIYRSLVILSYHAENVDDKEILATVISAELMNINKIQRKTQYIFVWVNNWRNIGPVELCAETCNGTCASVLSLRSRFFLLFISKEGTQWSVKYRRFENTQVFGPHGGGGGHCRHNSLLPIKSQCYLKTKTKKISELSLKMHKPNLGQ